MFGSVKQLMVSAAVLLTLLMSGCAVVPEPHPGDPKYAPVVGPGGEAPAPNPGGIYQPGYGLSLFEDRRAVRVGDILTVVLTEQTRSTKSADTEVKKENDLSLGEGTILGDNVSFGDYSLNTSVKQDRDFKGEASSDQSNSLQGSITVSVVGVLPNGLLVVRGEKWLTLNRGEEYIRVSGLVRAEDVSPQNTIASTKLADARITYSGTGELAESNRQGWASRFFNSEFWPF